MKIKQDQSGRIHLVDDFQPYGSIIFEIDEKAKQVAVYQDCSAPVVRQALEDMEESAQFSTEELINGLEMVILLIKESQKYDK